MSKKACLLTDDGVRIAPLSRLGDFEVAQGYVDVRGWEVASSDGRDVGKVHDLLVDLDGMRTRYLQVRLHPAVAATTGDRDVLVPIGSAQIAEGSKRVVVPLDASRIPLLPAFDNRQLLRAHEAEIRRHFSLGEAAAAAATRPDITRVPVRPDETVVLEKGVDGHDEIVIRRPEA